MKKSERKQMLADMQAEALAIEAREQTRQEQEDYNAILNAHRETQGQPFERIVDIAEADPAAVLNRIIGLQRRIEVLEAALRITKRPDPNRIIRVDGEDYEVLLTKNLRVTLATIAEGETISLDAGTQGVRFERIGEDQ